MQTRILVAPFQLLLLLFFSGCEDFGAPQPADTVANLPVEPVVTQKLPGSAPLVRPKSTPGQATPLNTSPAVKLPAGDEALAERVVDYLLARKTIDHISQRALEPWTCHWIASYEESLNLRIARAMVIYFDTVGRDVPNVEDFIKARLGTEHRLETSPVYVNSMFKMGRQGLVSYERPQLRQTTDTRELQRNNSITPDQAAKIVLMAVVIESATTQEHLSMRMKVKDQLREAVRRDPDIIQLFLKSCETTDEVLKSRVRVSDLIQQAQKNQARNSPAKD